MDADGRTALMAACTGGHDPEVPVFHQTDASGLGPEGPGLFAAAWAQENLAAIELLLEHGAVVDRADNDGSTALIHAAGTTALPACLPDFVPPRVAAWLRGQPV